jgi:transporter family-2 protein
MSNIFSIFVAVLVGACLCLQPIFISNIGKQTGALEASLISILTTVSIMLLAVVFFGKGDISKITDIPKYYLLAGVFGLIIVVGSAFSVRILGPATALSIAIAAQVTLSVFLEYYGVLGIEQVPMSFTRVIGIILMIFGVIFIKGLNS